MRKKIQILFFCIYPVISVAQTNTYNISFENAAHHEANITAVFSDIDTDTLFVQMSRSSPGRYAIHEFAKNVYNFNATDNRGNVLNILRPDPYRWAITGHNGTVAISYTLFANRGDGTYSQIDETHAHLNVPATFIYAPQFSERQIEVNFQLQEDLNWKIATQLQLLRNTTYTAPNLQYFMDSPTEISDFELRSFTVASDDKVYNIQLALHHNGSDEELDAYFESVKRVVLETKEVFGEFPEFDFGSYTFLACYVPNATGDGMEHRNSTVLTSTRSLAQGGMENNISTVAHEFFHAWNVERIRPKSLEPFDFSKANMSGELWFAEGFTSYYTGLILCRAGLRSPEQYINELTATFNYVWNSPARQFYNPVEMSYQAPFVDAAAAIDPVNMENTFISYYSYGSVLGLALDLSLRKEDKNLDDYMKLVWKKYGKTGFSYTLDDLHESLNQYAGATFGDHFFNNFIYNSEMPDYKALFGNVGVILKQNTATPYFGAMVGVNPDGTATIQEHTRIGSPAYLSGLDKGDVIRSINGMSFENDKNFSRHISKFKIGERLDIAYHRFGKEGRTKVVLSANPSYTIELQQKSEREVTDKILKNREDWLKIK